MVDVLHKTRQKWLAAGCPGEAVEGRLGWERRVGSDGKKKRTCYQRTVWWNWKIRNDLYTDQAFADDTTRTQHQILEECHQQQRKKNTMLVVFLSFFGLVYKLCCCFHRYDATKETFHWNYRGPGLFPQLLILCSLVVIWKKHNKLILITRTQRQADYVDFNISQTLVRRKAPPKKSWARTEGVTELLFSQRLKSWARQSV